METINGNERQGPMNGGQNKAVNPPSDWVGAHQRHLPPALAPYHQYTINISSIYHQYLIISHNIESRFIGEELLRCVPSNRKWKSIRQHSIHSGGSDPRWMRYWRTTATNSGGRKR